MVVARCPRPRRNLVKCLLFLAAAAALVTYFRFLPEPRDSLQDVESDLETSDRKSWLEGRIRDYERRTVPGLGRNGEAAHLEGEERAQGKIALKTVALDTVVCDRVPLNRTLRDPRNKG